MKKRRERVSKRGVSEESERRVRERKKKILFYAQSTSL